MGGIRCHLKTIMKGSGRYHSIRWNVYWLLNPDQLYLEPIRKVLNPVYLILPVLERREPRCRMTPLE